MFYGLKAVLDGHTGDDLVSLSEVRERVRPRSHSSATRIAEVLAELELLHDDTTAAITSGDIDTVLKPLRGHRRYNAIMALRSLFRFAKRRGLTFADPTRHLSGGRGAGRIVLPMTAEQIQAVEQAAVTPSRRITLASHRQRLGELAGNALLAWLGYRRATWPDTASRHVLVSRISAPGTGPVSPDYLDKHQPHGISPEHIRRDRSPGRRRRPCPPRPGLQHRPHQRDGLRQRRPQPSQRPGRTGPVYRRSSMRSPAAAQAATSTTRSMLR